MPNKYYKTKENVLRISNNLEPGIQVYTMEKGKRMKKKANATSAKAER